MAVFQGTDAGEVITPDAVSETVTASGGARPGDGIDTIDAGRGNDVVAGGGGDDIVNLGGGFDSFTWNSGDGSDIVDGGDNSDLLFFNGSDAAEQSFIAPNAGRLQLVHRNVDRMDLSSIEFISFNALDGADFIAVASFGGSALREVRIDLAGRANPAEGDGAQDIVRFEGVIGADTLTLSISEGRVRLVAGVEERLLIAHADADDIFRIEAGSGDNVVDAGLVAAGHMRLELLTADGADIVTGSQGEDRIDTDRGVDLVIGGRGDDVAILGGGDDRFIWNDGDGADLVNGQGDTDTLALNGSAGNDEFGLANNGGELVILASEATVIETIDVERVELAMAGGSDRVRIGDLTGTAVERVRIDLGVDGAADDLIGRLDIDGATEDEDDIRIDATASGLTAALGWGVVRIDHVDEREQLIIAAHGGDDRLDASAVDRQVLELALDGGAGDDLLISGFGDEALLGGEGSDTIDYRGSDGNVAVDLSAERAAGGYARETSFPALRM
jgi:Ca2+-binding RTX toxin-like protein